MNSRAFAIGGLLLLGTTLSAGDSDLVQKSNQDDPPQKREIAPPPRMVQPRSPMGGNRPGEVITPAAKGERLADKLKVGDIAPEFTLASIDGKKKFTLSEFQGSRPVVLIFASYT